MVAIVLSGYAPNKAPKLPEGVRTSCRGPHRIALDLFGFVGT
jgi:hypothetical protein